MYETGSSITGFWFRVWIYTKSWQGCRLGDWKCTTAISFLCTVLRRFFLFCTALCFSFLKVATMNRFRFQWSCLLHRWNRIVSPIFGPTHLQIQRHTQYKENIQKQLMIITGNWHTTVGPLYKGHIGTSKFVHCREFVHSSEVENVLAL